MAMSHRFLRRAVIVAGLVAILAVAVFIRSEQRRIEFRLGLRTEIGAPTATAARTPVTDDSGLVARLAVAGDYGTGEADAYATATVMDELDEELNFDALLLLGDNVYPSGDPDQLEAKVFRPLGPVLDDTDLIAVLGNHDIRDGNGPAQAAALGMPGFWYSREIGNTLLIALDSNIADDPDQLLWLESVLAEPRPTWTIVLTHHPGFSGGQHGSDPDVKRHFVPLFERYGVDLVLSGHDHDYQRSSEINGTTYVVSGGAARIRPTSREDFTEVAWSALHFVDLAVYQDRIEGQAIDVNGRAIDSFTVRPGPAETGG